MTSRLQADTKAEGRPTRCLMTANEVGDCSGTITQLSSLPRAERLLDDRSMPLTGSRTP
jgi:hypothetical protein